LQLHRRFITKNTLILLFFSDVEIGFTGPCGSCRQILAEFDLDLDIYLINPKNESKMYKLRELLPIAFTPRDLEKPRTSHDITD
jgi:cytidine deaminase